VSTCHRPRSRDAPESWRVRRRGSKSASPHGEAANLSCCARCKSPNPTAGSDTTKIGLLETRAGMATDISRNVYMYMYIYIYYMFYTNNLKTKPNELAQALAQAARARADPCARDSRKGLTFNRFMQDLLHGVGGGPRLRLAQD